MIIKIDEYEILSENTNSIKNISFDDTNNTSLVDLLYKIVDFDTVTKLAGIYSRKSCDGFWNLRTRGATFIEFKNGAFDEKNIEDKFNDSQKTMNEIIGGSSGAYSLVLVYNEAFVLKKDSRIKLTGIIAHVLSKAKNNYKIRYSDKILNIKANISNSLCFNEKEFVDFINVEY